LVEASEVWKGHEDKSTRLEGPQEIAGLWMLNNGKQPNAFTEIGLPQEIEIVSSSEPERFILPGALDIGFDDRLAAKNFHLHFLLARKDELGELFGCECSGDGG
jgi:hypothetical protein